MYKILYPRKDSSVYERYPDRNTGIDQILEIKKYAVGEPYDDQSDPIASWGTTYNSRIFIQFDLTDLQTVYDNSNNTGSAKYYLVLNSSEADSLQTEYTLYAYPLAQSWKNGNGYYNDDPEVTNGVSWVYRSGELVGDTWSTGSGTIESVSVSGGGSWNSNYEATQSFSFQSPDVRMDVTNIVDAWLSGTIPNYGFVIKLSQEAESNFEIYGSMKFFSRETHTIYLPKLEAFFPENQTYTGSFTSKVVATDPYVIWVKNLKSKYTRGEVAKFRLGVRDQYITKSYSNTSSGITERKLPTNTLFSIVDHVTNLPMIPFDSVGTKVNMDNNGHFILVNTESLLPVRFYKILFKIFDSDGNETIIDNNISFRVER